jgi:hypothetical protein
MNDSQRTREKLSAEIAQLNAEIEGLQAKHREKDTALEALKGEHYQAGDALHTAGRGEFYAGQRRSVATRAAAPVARDSAQRLADQNRRRHLAGSPRSMRKQQQTRPGHKDAKSRCRTRSANHERLVALRGSSRRRRRCRRSTRRCVPPPVPMATSTGNSVKSTRAFASTRSHHANTGKTLSQLAARRRAA